ncbi:MAG: hypothetical protein JW915_23735 [Chitinispirillaceae bacterium]|nr:hypothetical protein [Chitinispirillaceae bacterium]
MKRTLFSTIVLITAAFFPTLFSCTSGIADSGGGGIDIGNPTKVCVVDSANHPVRNASIKLIPSNDWIDQTLQGKNTVSRSFTTDASGIATLDSLDSGTYNIQVDHVNGGAFINGFTTADSSGALNIRLENYGSVSGKIISGTSNTASRISLAGSAYSASVGADGSFTLAQVVESVFVPMVMSSDSRWTIAPSIAVTAVASSTYNRNISFTTFLIEDFENLTSTSGVGGLLRRDGTYTKAGTGSAEYSIVSDAWLSSNALEGLLIRKGSYALVGLSIGYKPDGDSLWDFSKATGFSFYGKGRGTVNISFETDTLDKLSYIKHYSASITFSEEWQHIVIPFDSLSFYPDDNPDPLLSWKECAPSVKRIEFNVLEGDTVRFWIDDLTVEGTDFSEVY